jgi:hypothetical protein
VSKAWNIGHLIDNIAKVLDKKTVMKLAVMQPYFLPYLGYFQLIHSAEHFMFFDDVQYIKKSWMSRNRLLNIPKNEPFYTRPELIRPKYKAWLPTVRLEPNEKWKKTLIAQLKGYKNKASFYDETLQLIEKILDDKYKYLANLNIKSIIKIAYWLGINIKFDRYSDYDFWFDEKPEKGDWGREVAISIEASHYINAPGGESFILPEKFEANGIKLGFLQPKLMTYDQKTSEFIPNLSIIDVLMFNGKEKTAKMLKNYKIKWCN